MRSGVLFIVLLVSLNGLSSDALKRTGTRFIIPKQKRSDSINVGSLYLPRNGAITSSTSTLKKVVKAVHKVYIYSSTAFRNLYSKLKPRPSANRLSQVEMKKKHLSADYGPGGARSRIQKELRAFIKDPPPNCRVSVGNDIRVWVVTITGTEGTLYQNEKYKLKIVFPTDYPSRPPSVYFLSPVPRHEHVYSNGDICLNLLGKDWQPTMSAQGIAISVLSMLSSAKEKKIPPDNAMHAESPPGQKQVDWMYHDDRC